MPTRRAMLTKDIVAANSIQDHCLSVLAFRAHPVYDLDGLFLFRNYTFDKA